MNSAWVPIRLDVSAEPHQRIIDTVLIDTNTSLPDASQLAYSLVADALTQSIVRSGRHFTGRLDSTHIPTLWKQGTKQLEDQFRTIQEQRQQQQLQPPPCPEETVSGGPTGVDARKRDLSSCNDASDGTSQQEAHILKKQKIIEYSNTQGGSRMMLHSKKRLRPITTELIPIHLRLCFNGIYVHDDFMWDPNLEDQFSPLEMATRITHDLNLAEDSISIIAIAIVEQIHGISMADIDEDDTERTTAAWPVPSHTNINHSSIVSRNHPPKVRK